MSKPSRVVIIQTYVPDFRLPVFDELYRRLNGQFRVWSGEGYFSPTQGAPATGYRWHSGLRNHFLLGKLLLWQSGHISAALGADVCVVEFNPRILSTWFILLFRRIFRMETVIWGHLFPRAGSAARTRVIRFLMLLLADRVNLYTQSEAEVLRNIYPWVHWNVSPNAVMWRHECEPAAAPQNPRRRFLYVARLVEEKKPLLLLEAFALALPRLDAAVTLDFVGDGPLHAGLAARVAELGLQGRVNLHGSMYGIKLLRPLYAEAIASVSPGYVGLSATQSFGLGVPMLIARHEHHSVEIELCEEGFNCAYFPSDSPQDLADTLVGFSMSPPAWSLRGEAICNRLREAYTYDQMCDGFMAVFASAMHGLPHHDAPVHVGIAWYGLPYYAARVIQEAMIRHPGWQFTVISSRDVIPYKGVEEMVGGKVHWLDATKRTSWKQLGESMPDLLLVTSWPHAAYQSLAMEARETRETHIISMVDNYLRYTPKQVLGYFYYRLHLREIYSAVWVPGAYSRRFLRYLGMADPEIYEGLYSADPNLFFPPPQETGRTRMLFVGQLIERKGVLQLAEAAKRLACEDQVFLIGQGPLAEQLAGQDLVVEGFRQPRELGEAYREASALVLPSRIDHWGVVAHEAALSGCLLLVTKQCGCAGDLVQHGVNGYIMQECSTAEVELAIQWWQGLTPEAVTRGRLESIRRANNITPARWADTLDELVRRYVPRAGRAV